MYRRLPTIVLAGAICVVLGACAPPQVVGLRPQGADGAPIRIGIKEDAAVVRIESEEVMRATVGPAMLHGHSFQVNPGSGQILVTGSGGEARGDRIACESMKPIRVDGVAYRGKIEVFERSGGLTVVNVIGLEDYLCGVAPKEIGYLRQNEIEAMKAQVVAARTYAVAHLDRRDSHGFDLYGDVRDQVYGGIAGESDVGNAAVEATRGKVITYRGRPIEAYFHSTCGGSTADINDVWDSEPVPYLRRVYDADDAGFHCQISPHFRWVETYTREQVQAILADHLPEGAAEVPPRIGRVRDMEVVSVARSGRALSTRVTTDQGTWYVGKQKLRNVLRRPTSGAPILRSDYVRLFCDRGPDGSLVRLVVSGGGNGHGLGMCQWGAIGMARKGCTMGQIIHHYYHDVQITDYQAARLAQRARVRIAEG